MSSPSPAPPPAPINTWDLWAPILLGAYTVVNVSIFYRLIIVLATPNRRQRPSFWIHLLWHLFMFCSFVCRSLWLIFKFPSMKPSTPPAWNNVNNRLALCFFLCALNVTAHHWLHVVTIVNGPASVGGATSKTLSGPKGRSVNDPHWFKFLPNGGFLPEKLVQSFIIFVSAATFAANIAMVIYYGPSSQLEGSPFYDTVLITTALTDVILVMPFFFYAVKLVFTISNRLNVNRAMTAAMLKIVFQMGVYTATVTLHLVMYLYRPITGHYLPMWMFINFTYSIPELVPTCMQLFFYAMAWGFWPFGQEDVEAGRLLSDSDEDGSVSLTSTAPKTNNKGDSMVQGLVPATKTPSKKSSTVAPGLRNVKELPPLTEVLCRRKQNQAVYDSLLWFLEKEFSEENLLFWDAAETLVRDTEKENASKAQYKDLVSTYIVSGSPKEINIPGPERERLIELLKNDPPNWPQIKEAVTVSQNHVQALLKKDCYPRFAKYHAQVYQAVMNM